MQFRRYSRHAASSFITIALCSFIARRGEPDSPAALPAGDSPRGAASRLIVSYGLERLDDYGALLMPGFHFFFGDSALQAARPHGFTRDDELASARHLFEGFTDRSGIRRPAARSIQTSLDTMCASDEPGKPDSTAQYQVVVACGVRLRIQLEDGSELDVGPQCHELHFVRGDAAARGPDQPGDLDHWYLWRWVESSSCEAVAALAARASPQPRIAMGPGRPDPPLVLRVPNPAHGAVGVWMRLPSREPARLLMFDIAGRRVLEQDLGVPAGVESRIELSGAASLPAGIYWLRGIQGGRVGPARAVVLR